MSLTSNETNIKEKENNSVVDISLDVAKRTRFRINGDNDSIIELNLSDLGILDRLKEGMYKLQEETAKLAELPDDLDNLSEAMKKIDEKMREYVDYIFDYPVSDVCAKYGTMYDPKNGKFRYETIIEGLVKLYTDNINDEYRNIEARLKKHTDKYTKKGRK